MLHPACLVCLSPVFQLQEPGLSYAIREVEKLQSNVHHHHVMRCDECGAIWFDDVITNGFGLPMPDHRGGRPCPCSENGTRRFQCRVYLFRVAERDCRCKPADLYDDSLVVNVAP